MKKVFISKKIILLLKIKISDKLIIFFSIVVSLSEILILFLVNGGIIVV